jgi:AsmA protein
MKAQLLTFSKTSAEVKARGGDLPPRGIDLGWDGDVTLNMAQQTVTIPKGRIELPAGGDARQRVRLNTQLTVTHYQTKANVTGDIHLLPSNLRHLMAQMGMAQANMANPAALTHVELKSGLQGNGDDFRMTNLDLKLDNTHLTGAFRIMPRPAPQQSVARFDLVGDRIDLDGYLASDGRSDRSARRARPRRGVVPNKPRNTAPPTSAGSSFAMLAALALDGKIKLGQLKVRQGEFSNITMILKGRDGQVAIDPLDARFYNGDLRFQAFLNARANPPSVRIEHQMTNTDVGAMLQQMARMDRLTGKANIKTHLEGRGRDWDAMSQSLAGTVDYHLFDGTLKGIDVIGQVRDAIFTLKGRPQGSGSTGYTAYSQLKGRARLQNWVFSTNDLDIQSPVAHIRGQGSVDIQRESLDFRLLTRTGAIEGLGGRTLDRLKDTDIPVRVSGPLSHPHYEVDLPNLIQQMFQEKVQEKIQEKLGGKIGKELGGKLPPGLNDVIKNLPLPLPF